MKSSMKKKHQEIEPEIDKNKMILVGMKLDQESKELLTWVLAKVAHPGDSVIALHVLTNTETSDQVGNSPLLSLLKAFDSLLSVYEGFCNLKQVDLKLKISRGSSARKTLVKEVKSSGANRIIVGTSSKNRHSIRSSASVAKYLAKKLPKEVSVIAVNNGKVGFQRESTTVTDNGNGDQKPARLLLNCPSRKSNMLSESEMAEWHKSSHRTFAEELLRTRVDYCEHDFKQSCLVCKQSSVSPERNCKKSSEELPEDSGVHDSLALVPSQPEEAVISSVHISELIELKPGWPLLRQATMTNHKPNEKKLVRKMSVVQWAMQLPNRQSSLVVYNPEPKQHICDQEDGYRVLNLDSESGAIVPVGINFGSPRSSFESSKPLPKALEDLHEKYSSTCRLFEYQELVAATSNFAPDNLIGRGGNSQVYKGCLRDGKELAVKILNASEDAVKEFVLEIEIITAINHRNVISLFGFCFDDSNLLLVYDFLSRGSLEENLHGSKNDSFSFGWGERYKVAIGVAEALQYLHSNTAKPVIHRDVKSSNVLLSEDFEPQLSDFGLAKWASTSSYITCTDVAGTFGYLAPEYFMYGKVNEKIDVYAYGVVLLEILSGRKPISHEYPKGQESLVMWAKPILDGGKVVQLLDPTLGNNYDGDQMERMALAASLCIQREPRARPHMSLVSKLLQGDEEVTKWARQQVLASEEFDRLDDEMSRTPTMQSHLNLALLDVEDDYLSMSSIEQGISLENYLQGRCSRSSSFD